MKYATTFKPLLTGSLALLLHACGPQHPEVSNADIVKELNRTATAPSTLRAVSGPKFDPIIDDLLNTFVSGSFVRIEDYGFTAPKYSRYGLASESPDFGDAPGTGGAVRLNSQEDISLGRTNRAPNPSASGIVRSFSPQLDHPFSLS
jgi:hypothetical protein